MANTGVATLLIINTFPFCVESSHTKSFTQPMCCEVQIWYVREFN